MVDPGEDGREEVAAMEERTKQMVWVGAGVGLAAVVVMGLVGAVLVQTVTAGPAISQAQRAREEAASLPRMAQQAAKEADEGAAREMQDDARRERQAGAGAAGNAAVVTAAVIGLLRRADDAAGAGKPQGARALLSAAVDEIEANAARLDVMTRAGLCGEAGRVYERIGDREPAAGLFEKALREIEPILGPEHPEVRRLRAALERARAVPGEP